MSDSCEVQQQTVSDASSHHSAWGTVLAVPAPCSLQEVMGEQLAMELQEEYSQPPIKQSDVAVCADSLLEGEEISETDSDLALARMLQKQFDKEYDRTLKLEEDHCNKHSRVALSFKNYQAPKLDDEEGVASSDDSDSSVESEEEDEPADHTFGKRGICGKGKNIITKHDLTVSGRKNAAKIMENFPADFETGDGGSFDMQLSNHVYNQLKAHAMVDTKRRHRLHEKKEHSTAEHAMDAKTRLIVYKLVNGGTLEEVNGIINSGKEAVVFHAFGGHTEDLVPRECAVKIFKTTVTEFRNRSEYIKHDGRYFKDHFKKQNIRKIMKIWAKKEEANLKRMEKAGIRCPTCVVLRKHVLVMSFIGRDQVAAPKLKDVTLTAREKQSAYDQCFQNMQTMYRECHLIHADLSEYNMLWWNGVLYFIDVAQAVEIMHENAYEFLLRDCSNVSQFFTKAGVPNVPDQYELFNLVTDFNLEGKGKEFLTQLQEYRKKQEKLQLGTSAKNYPFDFFFELTQKETTESDTKNDTTPENNSIPTPESSQDIPS